MPHLRRFLTFANVVSVLALFVALGGSSYAAYRINGARISDRSIGERKIKRNTLGAKSILESRLGKVRRARQADTIGTLRPSQLKVRCASGTYPLAGVCFEFGRRPAAAYGIARLDCALEGKRLPSYSELATVLGGGEFGAVSIGELTSDVYLEGGALRIVTVTNTAGGAAAVPDTAAGARPYRCVSYPRN